MALFRGGRQLRRGRKREADTVEVRFRGSKGNQGKKEAVLVRTRNGRVGGRASGEGAAAELLEELFGMFKGEEMRKKRG